MFESLKAYLRWWSMWRSVPVHEWIKGAALYRAGKFDRALELYRRGLDKHDHHPAALTARLDYAYCLFQVRRLDAAREELRQVIRSCPTNREARVRLIRLHLWSGQPLEAGFACRRALQSIEPDGEIVGLFLLAALEHNDHQHLLNDAIRSVGSLSPEAKKHPLVRVADARLDLLRGDYQLGKQTLAEIANEPNAPFDGVLLFAELLLEEGNLPHGRHQLRRALRAAPNHPRVLSMLASTYLTQGAFFNAEFGLQLSLAACQNSGWVSPREMHVLSTLR